MIERKLYSYMEKWQEKSRKKALLICGMPQVGKTSLVRTFCRAKYEQFIELNFGSDERARELILANSNKETLIDDILSYKKRQLVPGRTAVFFDDIHAFPPAREAMKYLVKDGSFDCIEAGSFIDMTETAGDFEEVKWLYPLNFEEFCKAMQVPSESIDYLRKCYDDVQPVSVAVHETMLKLLRLYMVVGGMPSVVNQYLDTQDIGEVIREQREIIEIYRNVINDFSEKKNAEKIRRIFDNTASQLNDTIRRFVIADIDNKGRANTYESSFKWLIDSGIGTASYNVNEPQSPLQLNEKKNLFKFYLGDTGLLCAMFSEKVQFEILNGNTSINKGSILENFFAQELKAKGVNLHYFGEKKYGEIDFLIQENSNVDIIELNDTGDYKNNKALKKISDNEKWNFRYTDVYCHGNIMQENNIRYLPFYMILFYGKKKEKPTQKYTIDLSALKF